MPAIHISSPAMFAFNGDPTLQPHVDAFVAETIADPKMMVGALERIGSEEPGTELSGIAEGDLRFTSCIEAARELLASRADLSFKFDRTTIRTMREDPAHVELLRNFRSARGTPQEAPLARQLRVRRLAIYVGRLQPATIS